MNCPGRSGACAPGALADSARAVLLGVLALVTVACGVAEPDPLGERLAAVADSRTAAVLTEMLQAYGGYETWTSRRNAEYTYRLELYDGGSEPQVVSRQIHRLGLGSKAQAYIEDLDVEVPQIVRLDGDDLEVTRGGEPVRDAAHLDFPAAYGQIVRWTFRSPWHLLDWNSRLSFRAARTPQTAGPVPTGACDVIRLQLDENGPWGSEDDWHDFYISRLSRLVEQIHSYRAVDNSYRVSIWSDHRAFDGLRVASRRHTYASDESGTIGPLEAIAEYADVRFDAPFDDEMFHPMFPLAASALPESQ